MFKKIIWLIPYNSDLFNPISETLNDNGVKIITYPYNTRIAQLGFKDFQLELKELCKNSDLLIFTLFSSSHVLSPSLIREIKGNAFLVLFSFDDTIYSTHISINYAQILDLVVSTDFFGRGLFDQLGVKTIFYPFTRFLKRPSSIPKNKKIDISFIGNIDVYDRYEYIDALKDSGYKVEVFGKGSKNGFLSKEKFIRTILNTKINLNFTKVRLSQSVLFHEPWRAQSRHIKGRPFEIFSLGSFCLSEWAPSSKYLFGGELKLPQFFNKKELVDKVSYYLKNEEERNQIAFESNLIYQKYYAIPKSLIQLFNEIHNESLNFNRLVTPINFKESIYYLQRANITYWNLFLKLLKNKKPIKAFQTLIKLFNFKVFIYSALTFPFYKKKLG